MLIVQKFGGSSLADIEKMRRCAGICLEKARREHDIVAVVSAMGDTTDDLIDAAKKISEAPSPRETDALTTTGEQQSAALMAIMLQGLGAKARSLTGLQSGILTDCRYGSGNIILVSPERITETLSEGMIAVVTGYQGFCYNGDITSLGRGGSDTTAVALAAALNADRCEIYTDVDGIYTADPRIIKNTKRLETIDFRDMLALAESGSQVLHPKSVELAMANSVPLYLLSSFEEGSGSAVRFLKDSLRPDFAGVTGEREHGTVTLTGKAADASALSRIALMLAANDIAILNGRTGKNCVTVTVEKETVIPAMQLIHDEMIKI